MLFYIKDWAYRPLFSNFAAQKSQNKQHIMDNIKTQVARELLRIEAVKVQPDACT